MGRMAWLATIMAAGLGGCSMHDGGGMAKPTAQSTPAAAVEPASLYDRLGGMPAITAVTQTFLDNVAADPAINQRFARTDLPKLNALLVEQICAASGGPCTYRGKSMPEAHKGMAITKAEFNAMGGDLAKALATHNVPAREREELLKAIGSMEPEIVGL